MKKRYYLVFCAMIMFSLFFVSDISAKEHSFVGKVTGKSSESRLFSWFVDQVKPESAYMVIDEPVAEDGKVRHLYFEADGPSLDNFRIKSLKVETMFNDFGSVKDWSSEGPKAVKDIVMGYFDATMVDSDINGFLKGMVVEDKNGCWEKLHVGFVEQGLVAGGYYHVKKPVGVRIKVDLNGRLSLRNGSEIWLDKYHFSVNNADQSSFVEESIRDIQPIVDMKSFIFPVHIKKLELKKGMMRAVTRVEPVPFKGISFKYRSR